MNNPLLATFIDVPPFESRIIGVGGHFNPGRKIRNLKITNFDPYAILAGFNPKDTLTWGNNTVALIGVPGEGDGAPTQKDVLDIPGEVNSLILFNLGEDGEEATFMVTGELSNEPNSPVTFDHQGRGYVYFVITPKGEETIVEHRVLDDNYEVVGADVLIATEPNTEEPVLMTIRHREQLIVDEAAIQLIDGDLTDINLDNTGVIVPSGGALTVEIFNDDRFLDSDDVLVLVEVKRQT